ncbi:MULTISPECIES: MFS transporter [Duncaniella]|uniref:MFS transporter n=2 Tax=Duncaniella TaxID=2518495 RepID=A0A4P7W291_9BACT|nr:MULTISPECIES: MFS transporter [Duncaniella]QCD41957.1 MFS transporter [Duncaniella dubosii]
MIKIRPIELRLALMNFLEFGVWGAYLISLGNFLYSIGLEKQIGWFYTVQGIVSLFMPAVIGIIADRYVQAQRMLSLCHLLAGCFMAAAGIYCLTTSQVEFGPLFTLYTISVAFFMPTIGLGNSVAFNALNRAGLDTIKHFPPIRVFGTVGFICSMLFVNFTQFQTNAWQLITSAVLSFILAAYALTLPSCLTKKEAASSVADALGLKAFRLFKQKRMAIFFLFSMFLGVSLQITNSYGNTFITSFSEIAEYADTWGAHNANALISLSQMSETLCILLIPFCLKKLGIKGVMLMSMFAWVLRFGFFGLGNTGDGLWLLVISCIVYGIAFDFFNVSGGLYVDQETTSDIRSSAQGLFMIMTNGIGATIGTLCAQGIVNYFVFSQTTPEAQHAGWETSWFIFAAYALVIAILFMFIFKDNKQPSASTVKANIDEVNSGADGMIDE